MEVKMVEMGVFYSIWAPLGKGEYKFLHAEAIL